MSRAFSKILVIVVILLIIIIGVYLFIFRPEILIKEGSRGCVVSEDCVVFGKTGDCNCGCYNKDDLPIGISGKCFCAAPTSCKCADGTCEGVWQGVTDETFVWQIYRDEEYGFVVKYPQDWIMEVKQPSYLCQEGPGYECLASIQFSPPFPSVKILKDIDLVIVSDPNEYSASEWIEKYTPEILNDPQTSLDENMRIEENNWIKLLTVITKDNQRVAFSTVKSKKLYSFGTIIEQGMKETENILNQMLSTFRFIE